MTTHLANPIGPQIRPLLGVSLAILRCPSPRHWAADAVVLGGTMDRSPWTIWQYHMELWIFSWYSMRIIVFFEIMNENTSKICITYHAVYTFFNQSLVAILPGSSSVFHKEAVTYCKNNVAIWRPCDMIPVTWRLHCYSCQLGEL